MCVLYDHQTRGRAASAWPLSSEGVRLCWLRGCCAVAEGAYVPLSHAAPLASTVPETSSSSSSRCPPDVCVGAVLGDALHRMSALGGREGMPRSLGSVYGGAVTRFLGGSFRGVVSRSVATPGIVCWGNSVAVSVDGSTLLVSDTFGGSHTIHECCVADGSRRRVIGGEGVAPLQFSDPHQICIAPDGFVFVAEYGNNRVQVLTPSLEFHSFVGAGVVAHPAGVCADADVVVVSEAVDCSIAVFDRRDGALRRRFGFKGDAATQLHCPLGLCLLSRGRHVAVADYSNHRVSVFNVDGEFIRHVGVGVLEWPTGVAVSAFDELVVADYSLARGVTLFAPSGEVATRLVGRRDAFTGVAMHRSSVIAVEAGGTWVVVD